MSVTTVSIALTLAGCIVASFFDVRQRRIPNWLTGTIAVAAIAVHAFGGLRGLGVSLAVMAILTVAGSLVYSRGGIGGGDIKLAIAASALLSFPLCVPFLLYTAIGGGVLAVAFLAARGKTQVISRTVLMAAMGAPGLPPKKAETMPYAVAFAFGAILVALSQSVAPFLRITV
jgi:prepilin peptidase CpaA